MSEQVGSSLDAVIRGGRPADARESDEQVVHRLEIVRIVIAVSVAGLALLAVGSLLDGRLSLEDILGSGLVVVLGCGLLLHDRLQVSLARRRRSREAGMTRILQGLSRSMSPDAVVEAIVAELRSTAGADYVVVARVRRPDHVVEVTLVAARASVPPSRTWLRAEVRDVTASAELPLSEPPPVVRPRAGVGGDTAGHAARPEPVPEAVDALPNEPAAPARIAAEEIARRVRSAYGLPHTLTEPLIAERRFLGALILSRRTREPWGDTEERLLGWAALEVSAAFARAYALEEAERDANIDQLTGLPNRRYLDQLLGAIGSRRRADDGLAMLMVDIDHFKRLNDQHGHAAGDEVLREVAGAVAGALRAEDTPVRYGGEEFAVVLRRATQEQAIDVAERIRSAVAGLAPTALGGTTRVSASVGVAVADEEEDVATVIERADQALYRAKRHGRDRVELAA
ncbi:MAG: sensor domain-containing diguanylate cyclase [Chloroflexi bacterium]|nr:sensor domain-containing diguanylate cyclase [Chloroflexota bacterium]